MLYLIGLGLDYKDISVKALEAIKSSKEVYLENYTSLSNFSVKQLETLLKKKIIILNRSEVEEAKPFLKNNSALLIYGDPLSATTHIEILEEAKKQKIKTEVIHAPSVLTAIAETGLQLYKFGKVGSIPFWRDNYKPESFYKILEDNQKIKAHTLYLLDLDPKTNTYLTIKDAINQLIAASKNKIKLTQKAIGCARLGTSKSKMVYAPLAKLRTINFGKPPYCIVFPGDLHFSEEEFLSSL